MTYAGLTVGYDLRGRWPNPRGVSMTPLPSFLRSALTYTLTRLDVGSNAHPQPCDSNGSVAVSVGKIETDLGL